MDFQAFPCVVSVPTSGAGRPPNGSIPAYVSRSYPKTLGRFELVERLAVGGMAELFLAKVSGEHGFARTVVIKRLLPHLADDAHFNAMFVNEAKVTARLSHPKIAQTYELGRSDDQLYIAMEFVDGIDVLSLLRECAIKSIRIDPAAAVHVAHEILDGLDFAHNLVDPAGMSLGIIHRDISPSNILLSRRGDVKLVDFGIARAAQRHQDTKSGTLKGKYGYMSPEQVTDSGLDPRSDLFSVGVVLAEMLMTRRLFAAANELDVLLMVRDVKLDRLDKYGASLDAELNEILRRALKKSPDDRYSTAGEFRDALADWLFTQRKRVTPKLISELVEVHYTDAWERRKKSLAGEDGDGTAVLAQIGEGEGRASDELASLVDLGGQRLGNEPTEPAGTRDGVPTGSLAMTDSMPIISIERGEPGVDVDAVDEEDAHGAVPKASSTGADADADESGSIDIDLDDGASLAEQPAPPSERQGDPGSLLELGAAIAEELLLEDGPVEPSPSVAARAERSALGRQLNESGSFDIVEEDDSVPKAIAAFDDFSMRYPSIEAAVASLSSQDRDPAASDFDGSIVDESKVRARGLRVPNVAEISRTIKTPTITRELDTPSDDQGDFGETPPIAVLYRLAVARATGLLVATVGGIHKEIYLREGVPEFVSSNIASELFGEYLVAQGVLASGELSMALAMMPHYGGKLGDTLVGLGLMKPLGVFRHLSRQVRHKLIDFCSWSSGKFAWYAGRENPREAFPLDLNAYEVIGAGAMAAPLDGIRAWLDERAERSPRSLKNARVRPDHFELTGLRGLYDTIDGRRTVTQLRERYDADVDLERFERHIYLLAHSELLSID